MTPNPILKVLSTLATHQLRYLLMGGQACVLYGGAEFSKDTDIAVLAEPENLVRLSQALDELQASVIAVPPFAAGYLKRGHAIHFRCAHPEAARLRIDVMSVMRGVASFEELWERRTTFTVGGNHIEVMSLPDLVRAKKTQRDKDWPMIRRLVEAHHAQYQADPAPEQILFWLSECRTPTLLLQLAERFPDHLTTATSSRPLLSLTRSRREDALASALVEEEGHERQADRAYWAPLREELEQLRHERPKS